MFRFMNAPTLQRLKNSRPRPHAPWSLWSAHLTYGVLTVLGVPLLAACSPGQHPTQSTSQMAKWLQNVSEGLRVASLLLLGHLALGKTLFHKSKQPRFIALFQHWTWEKKIKHMLLLQKNKSQFYQKHFANPKKNHQDNRSHKTNARNGWHVTVNLAPNVLNNSLHHQSWSTGPTTASQSSESNSTQTCVRVCLALRLFGVWNLLHYDYVYIANCFQMHHVVSLKKLDKVPKTSERFQVQQGESKIKPSIGKMHFS